MWGLGCVGGTPWGQKDPKLTKTDIGLKSLQRDDDRSGQLLLDGRGQGEEDALARPGGGDNEHVPLAQKDVVESEELLLGLEGRVLAQEALQGGLQLRCPGRGGVPHSCGCGHLDRDREWQ